MKIIERTETAILNDLSKWTLVYGRRKTGKTFLIENFVDWDDYFFVNRDRTLFSKKEVK